MVLAPLPLVEAVFAPLRGTCFFTKLNLWNAYHLIRIRREDDWKTAFKTSIGHFEYKMVPSGLTNAPAVFQALVTDMPRDMLNRFLFMYIDDILIFSKTEKECIQHVSLVLRCLRCLRTVSSPTLRSANPHYGRAISGFHYPAGPAVT